MLMVDAYEDAYGRCYGDAYQLLPSVLKSRCLLGCFYGRCL